MLLNFLDNLFGFFGSYDKRSDRNKDVNGFGTWERFNRAIGKSMDNEVMTKVDNLLKNIYDPDTCLPQYVPYLESMMGYDKENNTLYISQTIAVRRLMLKKILRLYQIKGTKKSYSLLFSMLGITMVMTENFNDYSFDSPILFDDPVRRFDMKCDTCSSYTLALTGPPLTPQLQAAIFSIIVFNEPINARLTALTYNGNNIYLAFVNEFDFSYDLSFTS